MTNTDVLDCKMQGYIMADQYENAPLTDFDVVRSTQFVDDLTHGVRGYRFPYFEVVQPSCMDV